MATLPMPSNSDPVPSITDTTRKRGRDPSASAGETPSKRSAVTDDVIFRIVVPHKQIGRVIGKQGIRIQQVRANTGATIKIVDAVVPREDRVIIISSSKADAGGISSAENALFAVAGLILTENENGTEAVMTGVGQIAATTIWLLIARSQAGGLMGTCGQNIEQIRKSSGAIVDVLAQNQLPSCASAQESDLVVQVSGNVSEVLDALGKIACILRENPPKEIISIAPRYNYSLPTPNPPPFLPPYLPQPSPYMTQTSVDHVTFEMMILEKLVGGLIGKNGYNISKIRTESGATIKVSGVKGAGEQRLIQFGGGSFQVAIARMMVENYILSQLQPHTHF